MVYEPQLNAATHSNPNVTHGEENLIARYCYIDNERGVFNHNRRLEDCAVYCCYQLDESIYVIAERSFLLIFFTNTNNNKEGEMINQSFFGEEIA